MWGFIPSPPTNTVMTTVGMEEDMKQSDISHLIWVTNRLVVKYGENENVDFVLKMREIISSEQGRLCEVDTSKIKDEVLEEFGDEWTPKGGVIDSLKCKYYELGKDPINNNNDMIRIRETIESLETLI